MKVVYNRNFFVENKARRADFGSDPSWKNTVDAKIGDKVEFQMQYRNFSGYRHENVMVRILLPESLQYVEGSTYFFNTLHPDGDLISNDDIINNDINIGNYLPDFSDYVRITAKVIGDTMADGENEFITWAQGQAGPENDQYLLQNYAKVNVSK